MIMNKNTVIDYNSTYITVDGKPWFPVMGEMHYSRFPHERWIHELEKMKAGGVDIVSLYTIWIHHEEIEGEFDFTGDRNLREFIEDISKVGLACILRIGPWAHGEARNGGFPDWLLEREKSDGFRTRTDDEGYLRYVRRFYEQIYEQAKGFFLKDNGPVIGIQIENEYGHVGGQTGEVGEQHMRTLKALAQEIGFDVPLWTATGWGGAVTGGMIPVMGGYCEAPWDQRLTEIEPSGNYVFTRERNDHNIGSDHGLGYGITFDMDRFPYLTAELGGGLQVTDHRRPVATASDIGAMSMTKMGSGCNLLGYYMYHGGTNPEGKRTTLMESRSTGYPNDLPVLSYDFNAPLKEYGQITDTFREIRLLSMFVHDFGEGLCRMTYVPQPGNSVDPEDLKSLRTSVRYEKTRICGEELKSGYFFVNNYQRHYQMDDHHDVSLCAYDENGEVITSFSGKRDVEDGEYFFYPFNIPIGDKAVLRSATATPLCILHGSADGGKDAYVFYLSNASEPELNIDGDLDGNKIILLSREDALCAQKMVVDGREYLAFSDDDIVPAGDGYDLLMRVYQDEEEQQRARFWIWPDLPGNPSRFHKSQDPLEQKVLEDLNSGIITIDAFNQYIYDFLLTNPVKVEIKPEVSITDIGDAGKESFEVHHLERTCYYLYIQNINNKLDELTLALSYAGDKAAMFHGGKMIADSFYTGQTWEVGITRFLDHDKVIEGSAERADDFVAEIAITPLSQDAPKYLEKWPQMEGGSACRIDGVDAIAVYRDHII